MEIIRGLQNLKPEHHGCVATIGNFDGVHLGHQAVIGQLAEQADAFGLPAVVITFEPQPREFFTHGQTPARLTRFREKIQALLRFSVDRVLVLRFDAKFAAQSADEFIQRVLVGGLGVKYLVVGDDFQFGKGREGGFDTLRAAGEQHGFQVVNMHSFDVDGARVSSTRIREALAAGDLHTAEKLLGRPYRMCGRVAHGDKRGRIIGFPTANIYTHRKETPVQGVFAVELFGVDVEPCPGVANVGTRPTVDDGTRTLLEVHLFDFDQDIYGRHVNVNFVHKLRDEHRYESFDALKEQILKDASQARDFFAHR